MMRFVECFLVTCICHGLSQGMQGWSWDALAVGNGYGVVGLLYLCPFMELSYCPVGDPVVVAAFAETKSSALPVEVEFAGLTVPTD